VLSLGQPVCHRPSPAYRHQLFRGARTRKPLRLHPPRSWAACRGPVWPRCV